MDKTTESQTSYSLLTNFATSCIILNILICVLLFRRVAYSAKISRDNTENWGKNGLMDQINREELIDKFIYELPILRAQIDMIQDEISEIVGLSRQTYSALETRKRKMTWSNFMALLFGFYFSPVTRDSVENAQLFPDELKETMMINHRHKTKKNTIESELH